MNKILLRALMIAALAAVAMAWVKQHRSESRLREQRRSWQVQAAELKPLQEENERLSNSISQTRGALAKDQLEELVRLRAEAAWLRTQTNELQKLRAENGALRIARPTSVSAQHPATAGHEWIPLDAQSIAFAGYASPEATLQSFLSASASGDIKALRASYSDDLRSRVEELAAAGKLQTEIGANFAGEFPRLNGMQILAEKSSDPQTQRSEFVLLINGEHPQLLRAAMQNVNGTWKITGLSREPNSVTVNR